MIEALEAGGVILGLARKLETEAQSQYPDVRTVIGCSRRAAGGHTSTNPN